MAEKLTSSSPESAKPDIEQLDRISQERSHEVEERLERASKQSMEQVNDNEALKSALELAESKEEAAQDKTGQQPEKVKRHYNKPTKKELDANFRQSMTHIQKEMSPASRTFSKVIHNPAVEKVSEAIGGTIARPNLIIAGGLGTLILCSLVYLIAKRYGYVLSGFEAIGTFILGWCIGAVIEFARVGFINQTKR